MPCFCLHCALFFYSQLPGGLLSILRISLIVIKTNFYMKLHVREILYYTYLLFQHCLQSQWGEGVFKSIIIIYHNKGVPRSDASFDLETMLCNYMYTLHLY